MATLDGLQIHDGGDDELVVPFVHFVGVALHALVEGHHHFARQQNKGQYHQRNTCDLPTISKRYAQSNYECYGILDDGGQKISSQGFKIFAVLNYHVGIGVGAIRFNCGILSFYQFLECIGLNFVSDGFIYIFETQQSDSCEY